jgi:DNA-binding beta-propeller fold protein YncE
MLPPTEIGGLPASIAFSELSKSVYVANEATGTIIVVSAERHEVTARVKAVSELKAFRFAPGGRFGFAADAARSFVYILDASDNRIIHSSERSRSAPLPISTPISAHKALPTSLLFLWTILSAIVLLFGPKSVLRVPIEVPQQ